MNVNEMSDQEKSVMLARVMGWEEIDLSFPDGSDGPGWIDHEAEEAFELLDLYDPANMALAWRVLNWLHSPDFPTALFLRFGRWWDHTGAATPIWWYEHADAQRAWLDKILELAIEAGLVPD